MILDYSYGLNVVTVILIRGTEECQGQRKQCDNRSRGGESSVMMEAEVGVSKATNRGERQFLAPGKGKEMHPANIQFRESLYQWLASCINPQIQLKSN